MIVLGLDASAGGAGAALADEGGLRAAAFAGRGARPAAQLLALAERVLTDAGLAVADLEGVAVAAGPGSYAGVRSAVVSAKALAYAAGLPLAVVGSLEAFAFAAGPWPGVVWPAIDARRGRVYSAPHRWTVDGPVALRPVALLERAAFREAVGAPGPSPALLVGTGVTAEDMRMLGGTAAAMLGIPGAEALAGAVARSGRLRLLAGAREDPLALTPRYASEPEIGPPPGGRTQGRG